MAGAPPPRSRHARGYPHRLDRHRASWARRWPAICSARGYQMTRHHPQPGPGRAICSPPGRCGPTPRPRSPRRATSSSRWSAFRPTCARCCSGPDGALARSRPGTVLVDMTTSEPSLAVEIAEAAAGQARARAGRARVRRRRRCPERDAVDHGRRPGRGARRRPAVLRGRWARPSCARAVHGRRAAHQDGEPDPDRQHDGGDGRRAPLRLPRRPRRRAGAGVGAPAARPAAGRCRTSRHASSPATSRRASSSTTS